MFYLIMNGVKLPQPYLTYEQAKAAMDELAKMGPSIFDMVFEP